MASGLGEALRCIPNAITCITENGLFTEFCPQDNDDNIELFCSPITQVFDKIVAPVCSARCHVTNAIGLDYQCPEGFAVAPTVVTGTESNGTVCLMTIDEPDRLALEIPLTGVIACFLE